MEKYNREIKEKDESGREIKKVRKIENAYLFFIIEEMGQGGMIEGCGGNKLKFFFCNLRNIRKRI
jgi:hypothetical protein